MWTCPKCNSESYWDGIQLTKTNYRIYWRFCKGATCQHKEVVKVTPPIGLSVETRPFEPPNTTLSQPKNITLFVDQIRKQDNQIILNTQKPRFKSVDGHLVLY